MEVGVFCYTPACAQMIQSPGFEPSPVCHVLGVLYPQFQHRRVTTVGSEVEGLLEAKLRDMRPSLRTGIVYGVSVEHYR